MSNSEILDIIELCAKLLDLHEKDDIRVKTYNSAVFNLSRIDENLSDLSDSELLNLRGVGRLMAANIKEINQSGTLQELQNLLEITPTGIFDMFRVKGIGVKKIGLLWKNLGIDNLNDLRISCENNKIASEKGFGLKTQEAILQSLDFLKEQESKLRLNAGHELSDHILGILQGIFSDVESVGDVTRQLPIIQSLSFIVCKDGFGGLTLPEDVFFKDMKESSPHKWIGTFENYTIPVKIEKVSSAEKVKKRLLLNGNEEHFKFKNAEGHTFLSLIGVSKAVTEKGIYEGFGYPHIPAEMREGWGEFEWTKVNKLEDLIHWNFLTGTLHNHSTYSDGTHTLKQMADYAQSLGLSYFGIADHSQTAQYAGGLLPATVFKQHREIEELNGGYTNFRILKGIESDILPNGDLDYEVDVLKSFDYVVASVHSVLNMDIEKATARLIKAIENPFTSILGHLSGRLILSRNGYPLHYDKIIDACAANKVSIELNASPYRLDIDWTFIPRCMEKGVLISINPDAHAMHGLLDMQYGVNVARKGGLTKEMTLNALSINELTAFFNKSK